MIYDSRMAYMWSSLNNQGIKFPLKERDVYPDGFDTYQGLSFTCSHWTPDNSVYGLPKIKFIELTEKDISFLKTHGWFDNPTTHTVGFAIQKLGKPVAEETLHTIEQRTWSPLPKIVNYETLVEGDLVYIRLYYTGSPTGFGFVGTYGGTWAREEISFSNPTFWTRMSPGRVDYPFNHSCSKERKYSSNIEAWVYKDDYESARERIHLECSAPTRLPAKLLPTLRIAPWIIGPQ